MSGSNSGMDAYSGVCHSLSLSIVIPGVMRGTIPYCCMVGKDKGSMMSGSNSS
ncbi:unnamed protein product, partial [marine sediment metagenome]